MDRRAMADERPVRIALGNGRAAVFLKRGRIKHPVGDALALLARPWVLMKEAPKPAMSPACSSGAAFSDGRAVGSKEKGGRTWNQSSCRKLWLRQLLGRTVMTNLTINELLLLTCCGAFIASVTYAVKLSIEAF